MEPAKISIEGPYSNDGTQTGGELDLYHSEKASIQNEVNTNQMDIPTLGDSEALLASISSKKDTRYSGETSALRLMNAGFGSTPKQAVVNYLFRIESLVLPRQGTGYRLTDNVRDVEYVPSSAGGPSELGILCEEARWTHKSSEGRIVEWDVATQFVDGVQEADDRNLYFTDQVNRQGSVAYDHLEYDGSEVILGEVETLSYERSVDLNSMPLIHQTDNLRVGVIESGVKGEVSIQGRVSRADVGDLGAEAHKIDEDILGGQVTFWDTLTDRPFSGAVASTDTSFEAGRPNIFDYTIDIDIGEDVLG